MSNPKDLEALAVRELAARGLTRVPGKFAFAHRLQAVAMTVDESPYRGHYLTVHDPGRPARQFRQCAGHFDWHMIAATIVEIAESRLQEQQARAGNDRVRESNRRIATELATITGTGPDSQLSIQPSSAAPGKVRVRLSDVELDPASVMRLYAAVSHALPPARRKVASA